MSVHEIPLDFKYSFKSFSLLKISNVSGQFLLNNTISCDLPFAVFLLDDIIFPTVKLFSSIAFLDIKITFCLY